MPSRNLTKLLGLVVLAIGMMAMSASAAQAKYLLLLNGATSAGATLNLTLTQLGSGSITAENGLKIECTGGSGNATATMSEENKKISGTATATFTGCAWVGSPFCTINDGGKGLIKAKGTGDVTMEGANYLVTATSSEFATVKTEGEFCTIPTKEVVEGTAHALILEPLADTTTKLAHLLTLNLKLGNSKVKDLTALVDVRDENPSATWGIHLVELAGCTPIC